MLHGQGGGSDDNGTYNHDGGMAEGEHQAHGHRLFSLLHELAGHIVDGGNVVGINGVAQSETVGEKRGAEKDGKAVKGQERPCPGGEIEPNEKNVEGDDFVAQIPWLFFNQER
jgi:hypothetical protein